MNEAKSTCVLAAYVVGGLCCIVLVSTDTYAQTDTSGCVHGRVATSSSKPTEGVAGVDLKLESANGTTTFTTSVKEGEYLFEDLEAGNYTLSVTSPEFAPLQKAVHIIPGATVRIDLQVESVFAGSISVTATRTARPTEEIPASVSVISEQFIKSTPMSNLREALSGTPGTLIESKNQGYDSRLIIRGSGLKARYAIREIMVLLDGIPITDPDSLTRLDFVDTHMIERIEVVRGPNSTLWGINATGGVVNIITRSPFASDGGSVRIDLGNYGTRHFHVAYSDALGKNGAFNLNISRRESNNSWRQWNEFETTQFTMQPSFELGNGVLWENIISYTDAEIQLPGRLIVNNSLNVDQWQPYLHTGDVAITAEPWKNSSRDSQILFIASRLTAQLGPLLFKPQIFLNRWQHHHPVTGRINDAETLDGGLDLQVDYEHASGTLTGGISFRANQQDSDAYTYADVLTTPSGRIIATTSDQSGDQMSQLERQTRLMGVYLQESFRPGDGWTIDLGLRADRIHFEYAGYEWLEYDYSAGRYEEGEGEIDRENDFSALSPRLGAVRRLTEQLHAYVAVAAGTQTPTADELNLNPDLDLTSVVNYEVGLKGRYRQISFDTAVYYCPVRDEVVQIIQGHGETGYTNAGKTEKSGFELAVAYFPVAGLAVGGSYTYSDFVYDEFSEPVRGQDLDRSGNHLPYVPKHHYAAYASFTGATGF